MGESTVQTPDLHLAESIPLPLLLVHNPNRRVHFVNALLCDLCGYSPEEPLGMDLFGLVDFNDAAQAEEYLSAISDRVPSQHLSGRLLPKSGTAIPVTVGFSRLTIGSEKFGLVIIQPHKKRAPQTAKDQQSDEDYFRELFENANDLIYTMGIDGRITSANRAILNLFGYTLDEAIGLKVTDVIHPDFIALAKREMEAKLAQREFTPPYELLCLTKSGDRVWIEISTRVILREGQAVAVQAIARDISERKKAEELFQISSREIQEQKNMLERMIEQNPHAIAFWNPDGSFHRGNAALEKQLGFLPQPGDSLLNDFQIKGSKSYPEVLRAFSGETVRIARILYDPSLARTTPQPSNPMWLRVTFFPILSPEGAITRIVTYIEDITEHVRGEEDRDSLERRLLEAEKLQAIGTLAGGVAHDFNNLLTGIMGYLDLLRTMSDERTKPILDKADVVTQRASELTRQLLAYARKSRMETRVHDLNGTAQEVSALIRQTVDRRIEIRTRVLPEPATVKADPGQMNQVLMNLCLNARDTLVEKMESLTPSEAIKWQPRISIEIRLHEFTQGVQTENAHAGLYVRMSVSDNGLGMDEATRQRIFEPFFTTKAIGKGTGLGLATVFGVIKQHGGWVEVNSTPGNGTLFQIYLPYLTESAQPLSNAASSLRVKGGNETILLADDEEMIREIAQEILQNHGYRVILACDGWEAMELFQQRMDDIQLVILDITMPRLSGREIIPKLMTIRPETRIIAMSGYSFSESWPDFHNIGAAAFIQKPYNAMDLLQTVRRVLDAPSPTKLRK